GFAKGGKGGGRMLTKSAARPPESGTKQMPQSQVPAKVDSRTTVTREGDKLRDIDTRITVQPRRLGKSLNPNIGQIKPFSPSNPYHQRTLSALPRAPYSSVRNAIGLPISPRASVGRVDGLHPLVSPAVPNSATRRVVVPNPNFA